MGCGILHVSHNVSGEHTLYPYHTSKIKFYLQKVGTSVQQPNARIVSCTCQLTRESRECRSWWSRTEGGPGRLLTLPWLLLLLLSCTISGIDCWLPTLFVALARPPNTLSSYRWCKKGRSFNKMRIKSNSWHIMVAPPFYNTLYRINYRLPNVTLHDHRSSIAVFIP